MSSKKKNILNIGFLVLLLVLTFWLVFRDQDLGPIVEILGKVPIHFIFIGLILVVCYVCGESVIIKYLLHAVKIKAPLINCIRYSAASPRPLPADSPLRYFTCSARKLIFQPHRLF